MWKGPEEGGNWSESGRRCKPPDSRGGGEGSGWQMAGCLGGVGAPALARPQGQALGGLEGSEVQKLMQRMEKQREPEGPAPGQGSSAGEEAAVAAQQSSGGR